MQVHVGSKHLATDVSVALDASGREHLVVIAKATWSIPEWGQRPRPLAPRPIVSTDDYFGDPGESAMRYGADAARYKPQCDVIFDATAYSAAGAPVTTLLAGWQVGALAKQVRVIGPRVWSASLEPGAPAPFDRMPIRYSLAFGGTRWSDDGGRHAESLLSNPVGLGFAGPDTLRQMVGQPLPTLEAVDDPVRRPDGSHRSQSFGPIGRHWMPRKTFSGTYDEHWRREVFPFLPDDFDEAFNQVAPPDQQMPYPVGGEEVVLTRLMPHVAGETERRFFLPKLDQPAVRILRTDYSQERLKPVVDTLFFETDAVIDEETGRRGRFTAVWRVATPIRRRIQEFSAVTVGPVDEAWWAAKASGQADGACVGCGEAKAPALAGDLEEVD
ncbi:DUF2169 domain-containing protein [Mitsuaria sp. TWR114]|jgi:hypothetical protein|uniref:DUF2169 family type VI secretion system accessory protein n=1 Tax=unclassified Roseateles TaxID=2626991 RepID=UPI0011BE852F|nr:MULTISPECIES: DUF2169 domain-containing protein [unclassified Roseateles]MBB3281117.1 hypothetical protein [Mitsuaria sp. BK037]TXD86351.1 DUF2169 domain-containing protein [Mitsuaria sp. TWR114]